MARYLNRKGILRAIHGKSFEIIRSDGGENAIGGSFYAELRRARTFCEIVDWCKRCADLGEQAARFVYPFPRNDT
jgi:hypothetical protein